MQRVVVVNNNLEEALKKFKRISIQTRRVLQRHQYHLRPGLRMREKWKAAEKRRRRMGGYY